MNEFKFTVKKTRKTMMPFSYGNNRQKKRQKKKENTKTLCFGQHSFISVYRVNCGKYDTLCNKNIFQEEMYAKAMPFLWNCLYLFWAQAFFGIQIYLPLAHNN